MDFRSYNFDTNDGYSFYGLRSCLRSNEFWAATVITNFFTAFPIVGNKITFTLRGFSVDNATLNRFFSLHYLLPFLIAGVVVVHMAAVHNDGSNNPLGISSRTDKISFFLIFSSKILWVWLVV